MKKELLIGLFMLGASGLSQAASTTYSDKASWSSATSSYSTIDFNAGTTDWVNRGSSYLESGVTFTAPDVYSVYDASYDAVYHNSGYLDLEGDSLGINFGSNITALSFDFGGFYDNPVSLILNLINGEVFNLNAPTSAYGFFGITSDVGFSSISMTTTNSFTAFDNISFGEASTSVPEPATIALMGLGFACMAARRRKSV